MFYSVLEQEVQHLETSADRLNWIFEQLCSWESDLNRREERLGIEIEALKVRVGDLERRLEEE